ncbi:MAG: GGDEF domain-containing protein, partial [Myxococcales bacterium]
MTRQLRHALWGTAAATGAPLGWLALRVLSGACADLRDELAAHALLYGYLLAGTAMAFALFGAVTGRLADDVARANRRLAELSLTDGLTGLKNRRAFDEQLRRELERARRSGAPFAVVLVDLDHFKALNDRYGHPAGDRALQAAASLLGRAVRSQDSVYRVGGEEFAILCPGAGGKA